MFGRDMSVEGWGWEKERGNATHAQSTFSGEVNSMDAASLWSSLASVSKSRPLVKSVTQKWCCHGVGSNWVALAGIAVAHRMITVPGEEGHRTQTKKQ